MCKFIETFNGHRALVLVIEVRLVHKFVAVDEGRGSVNILIGRCAQPPSKYIPLPRIERDEIEVI